MLGHWPSEHVGAACLAALALYLAITACQTARRSIGASWQAGVLQFNSQPCWTAMSKRYTDGPPSLLAPDTNSLRADVLIHPLNTIYHLVVLLDQEWLWNLDSLLFHSRPAFSVLQRLKIDFVAGNIDNVFVIPTDYNESIDRVCSIVKCFSLSFLYLLGATEWQSPMQFDLMVPVQAIRQVKSSQTLPILSMVSSWVLSAKCNNWWFPQSGL